MKTVLNRIPFEWKTPHGYLLAFIAQFVAFYYLVQVATFLLSFFSASGWTLIAIVDDINNELNTLDEMVKSEQNGQQIKEKLFQFITLNVDAIQ